MDVGVVQECGYCPINNALPHQWMPLFWLGAASAGASSSCNNNRGNCHIFGPLFDV
jgi:hypothetical protein